MLLLTKHKESIHLDTIIIGICLFRVRLEHLIRIERGKQSMEMIFHEFQRDRLLKPIGLGVQVGEERDGRERSHRAHARPAPERGRGTDWPIGHGGEVLKGTRHSQAAGGSLGGGGGGDGPEKAKAAKGRSGKSYGHTQNTDKPRRRLRKDDETR